MTDPNLPDIPAGPLDAEPSTYLSHPDGVTLLTGLLDAAGVELGAYDRRIIDWLAGWDGGTVLTIASLLQRLAMAGDER